MPPILTAVDLTKRYNGLLAVDHISFEIMENEIFSLLGPNGAGKTTSISMLSTLLKPTEGTASIKGVDVVKFPMEARQHIGVVPQDLALYGDLTGRENLHFWGSMYQLKGKELRLRTDKILDRIGLTGKSQPARQNLLGRNETSPEHRCWAASSPTPVIHGRTDRWHRSAKPPQNP